MHARTYACIRLPKAIELFLEPYTSFQRYTRLKQLFNTKEKLKKFNLTFYNYCLIIDSLIEFVSIFCVCAVTLSNFILLLQNILFLF